MSSITYDAWHGSRFVPRMSNHFQWHLMDCQVLANEFEWMEIACHGFQLFVNGCEGGVMEVHVFQSTSPHWFRNHEIEDPTYCCSDVSARSLLAARPPCMRLGRLGTMVPWVPMGSSGTVLCITGSPERLYGSSGPTRQFGAIIRSGTSRWAPQYSFFNFTHCLQENFVQNSKGHMGQLEIKAERIAGLSRACVG